MEMHSHASADRFTKAGYCSICCQSAAAQATELIPARHWAADSALDGSACPVEQLHKCLEKLRKSGKKLHKYP